jgi:glyoxylase-like metal-dependent hydrolase (beta-lactamase superfamily II)
MTITDGIKADIIPVPSGHAKGSLLLMIDDEYLFTGDATYSMLKDGRRVHNAQLLKDQIDIISALPADKIILSHDLGKIRKKAVVLRLLKTIYSKRTPDSPYIYVD